MIKSKCIKSKRFAVNARVLIKTFEGAFVCLRFGGFDGTLQLIEVEQVNLLKQKRQLKE